MLRFMLREIYSSTITRSRGGDRVNIIVKSIVLIAILVLASIYSGYLELLVLMMYPIMLCTLSRDLDLLLHSLKAPIIPILLVSALTYIFTADIFSAITIGLRILVFASSILTYFSTTDPISLSYTMELLKLPRWIIVSTLLIWRLIPLSMRIVDESYSIARLKGDSIWRGLVAATATLYIKASGMTEALYMKSSYIEGFTLRPMVPEYSSRRTVAYTLASVAIIALSTVLAIW